MELQKQVTIVKQKQRTQAVCVITIKKIKMSKDELKFEKTSKLVVFVPMILLIVGLLLLSSCASSNYQACAAYASVELKSELKWRN